MRSPLKCLAVISILSCIIWCMSTKVVHAESAGVVADHNTEPSQDSRAKSQLLAPLTIDETYGRSEIPAESSAQSAITLRGAIAEAETHNKEVLQGRLEVSRFKWDYLAAETNRLPNVKVISYLAEQTANSYLVPARTNAFVFLSAMFPVTQQYRIGLEARP